MEINQSKRAKKLNSYKSGKRPTVMGIVLHDTAGAGSINDVIYLANDPDHRGISVDFVALRTGEIYQLNPDLTKYSTNHAGRHTSFKGQLNGNVNAHTIGIEISHEVYAGTSKAKQSPEWPNEQVQAVGRLCKQLVGQFHLTRDDITTHQRIVTDHSRTDPRNFPWAVFWAAFDGTDTPETVDALNQPIYHVVVAGDTLWGLAVAYHTSIEAIKALNNFDSPSTLITIGQKLLVKE